MQRLKLFSGALVCALFLTACDKPAVSPTAQPQSAAALRETPQLFINYWAIWCGPCREEIPELNKFARQHGDSLTVVAVNFDGKSGGQLQEEILEMGIEFTSIDLHATEQLGLENPSVLPTTYVLQNGELVRTLLGPQTLKTLEAALTSKPSG